MLIQDKLRKIIEENSVTNNQLFLRTLLKDALQDYVLRFIYESEKFKDLIFTGGTCLKKIYGLPRFSEDLDFDCIKSFDITVLEKSLREYFSQVLQYKEISTKITNNRKTIFLKFPILEQLGLSQNSSDSQILFLRCDLAEQAGVCKTEVNTLSTKEYSFFVLSYDLPTLFANKIIAFLEREYFKSNDQKEPFKGRDVFDLVWFLETSAKTGFSFAPLWERVFAKLQINSKKEVLARLVSKLEKINKENLKYDLMPFVANEKYIEDLGNNFLSVISDKGKLLFID